MTRKVGDIDGELSATVLNSFSMFKNARKSLTGPLSQYIIAPCYSGSLKSLLHNRANIDLELVVVSVLNALVIMHTASPMVRALTRQDRRSDKECTPLRR